MCTICFYLQYCHIHYCSTNMHFIRYFNALSLYIPSSFSPSLPPPSLLPSCLTGVVPRGVDLPRALMAEKTLSRQREIEEHRRRRMSDSSVSHSQYICTDSKAYNYHTLPHCYKYLELICNILDSLINKILGAISFSKYSCIKLILNSHEKSNEHV